MSYKKLNIFDGGINGDLDLLVHAEDETMGYCENCGTLLVHKEGRWMKFDSGDWQRLFCDSCYDLQVERQFSHV